MPVRRAPLRPLAYDLFDHPSLARFPETRFDRTVHLRRTASVVAFLSFLAIDAAAQTAAPDKQVCIAAAERGQELRDAKKMRDARAQFLLCSKKECPAAVAPECARWAAEAEAALASIKIEAVDGSGKKITDVKVTIDGAPFSDEIPAQPVFVDPGSHQIRFEWRAGTEPVNRIVSLAMGERDQLVQASFKDAHGPTEPAAAVGKDPPKDSARSSSPPGKEGGAGSLVAPLVLGGIGAAAIGTAATFWILGNSDLDAARERCAAGCVDSDADDAKTKHLVGDIALGVGIVAIAAAAYFIITREKAPQPVLRF